MLAKVNDLDISKSNATTKQNHVDKSKGGNCHCKSVSEWGRAVTLQAMVSNFCLLYIFNAKIVIRFSIVIYPQSVSLFQFAFAILCGHFRPVTLQQPYLVTWLSSGSLMWMVTVVQQLASTLFITVCLANDAG